MMKKLLTFLMLLSLSTSLWAQVDKSNGASSVGQGGGKATKGTLQKVDPCKKFKGLYEAIHKAYLTSKKATEKAKEKFLKNPTNAHAAQAYKKAVNQEKDAKEKLDKILSEKQAQVCLKL